MNYTDKYLKYKNKYLKLKAIEKKLLMKGGSNTIELNMICLFKADWCPHCIAFLPTWKILEEKMKKEINFVTYDDKENEDEIKKYNIDGFPTVILVLKDKAIEYVGPKNEQSLVDFINQYN